MNGFPQPIEPDSMFAGLRPSAILLGAIVDNLASFVSFGLLALLLAAPDGFSENEEVAEAAFEAAIRSPHFLVAALVLGFACTTAGAYVGARRAGQLHVRHGGWIAVTSAALAALSYLFPADQAAPSLPVWYELVGWALLLPAGLAGGLLARVVQPTQPGPGGL